MKEKICSRCGVLKDLSEYYNNTSFKSGKDSKCKTCAKRLTREWKQKNPGYHRKNSLKKQYNLTIEEYNKLRVLQGFRCKICKKEEKYNQHGQLDIDHCHVNGHVRGLLCSQCNTAIGLLGDDEERIRCAADYVRETKKTSREAKKI